MSAFVAVVGLIVGSFLNVCIVRWPAGESVVRPRSRCPRCARPVVWHENIPVLSWLALRGRCRGCGQPISVQYPLVELLTGACWLGAWLAFGPTLATLRVAVAATLLLGIAVTDLRYYLIPDEYTVTGLLLSVGAAVGVAATALMGDVGPVVGPFVGAFPGLFAGPGDALLGACVGAGAIAIIGWLGEVALGREAMGQGDMTLMAFVGAMVGPLRSVETIFLAALLASAVFLLVVAPVGWILARRRGESFVLPMVPFGVFLAPAALLALLWGERVIAWYLAHLGPVA